MKTPFKFLDPYELKDIESFFGREEETKQLYSMVTRNRLTFVYGPSGTGKTSLVQCGLASRFGSVDWLPLWIRRGEDINTALNTALMLPLIDGPVAVHLEQEDNISLIKQLFNRYLRPVYLIFDQFEELFILGDADERKERLPFYEEIEAIIDADLPCRILFVMREDYFGHLNHFEKIIPELYHRKLRVEPMSRDNLLRVIHGTCETFCIDFDDPKQAPGTILDYISGDKGNAFMPYVQVYLHMLYQEAYKVQYGDHPQTEPARPVTFTNAVIQSVGPIADVLGRFLKEQDEEITKSLHDRYPDAPEDLVRSVLDVFVTEEGTKAPLTYHSVGGEFILEGKQAQRLEALPLSWVSATLRELEKSKILRQTDDTFEVAHDSLALLIDQQRSVEQRQLNEIRRRLDTAYREHLDAEGAYFLDSGQLARIEPFLPKLGLDQKLEDFIHRSEAEVQHIAEAEREKEREKLRLTEEKLIAEAKGRRRQRLFSYIIGVIAVVAIGASVYGWVQGNEAEKQKVEAFRLRDIADEKTKSAVEEKIKSQELLAEIQKQRGITYESLKKTAEALQEVKNKEAARLNEEQLRKKEAALNIYSKLDDINHLLEAEDTVGARNLLKDYLKNDPNNPKLLKLKEQLKLE